MALTNSGFDGTVNEAQFAQMAAIGQLDGVASAADWLCTQGTGRQVSTAAGSAFAKGVLSVNTAAILTSLGTPVSGQWYLIARHIDWTTNTVTVVALPHTTTSTTVPTLPPSGFPTMDATPGTKYDQPLAWVWVNSVNTSLVFFDLRVLPNVKPRLMGIAELPTSGNWIGRRLTAYGILGAEFEWDGTQWLMRGVAEFASTSARDAVLTAPVAGMRALDTSTGITWRYYTTAEGRAANGWYPWETKLPVVYTTAIFGYTPGTDVPLQKWSARGGLIRVEGKLTISATSVLGADTQPALPFPAHTKYATPANNNYPVGTGVYVQPSVATVPLTVIIAAATDRATLQPLLASGTYAATTAQHVSSTTPIGSATNNIIAWQFEYEPA